MTRPCTGCRTLRFAAALSQVMASDVKEPALYKLDILNAVGSLEELRSPPGNRLEALKGDYVGFYSIRVNSQWRIVFRWQGAGAHDVKIVDYH
ncbi:proteic killer suppression protein [Marinobacter sp. LV10MA510-1]|nr:proteic killer suppression protein [Marinobacter sp. LV10MA510-1]